MSSLLSIQLVENGASCTEYKDALPVPGSEAVFVENLGIVAWVAKRLGVDLDKLIAAEARRHSEGGERGEGNG